MTKGGNNMDKNSIEKFLITQDKIDANKQETDKKQIKTDEKLTHITENFKFSQHS